jgi:hypothetical protein
MKPETLELGSFAELFFRLALNFAIVWLLIMGLYFRCCKRRSLVFCLFMFNLLIFIVGFILSNSKVGIGTGLGLFALFTMMRYRSESVNMREMTYLFVMITLGFVNSTRDINNLWIVIFLNLVILVLVYYLEKHIGGKVLSTEKIKYNNLELLKPQFRHLLVQDIFRKTGIRAKAIDIDSISFADDTASLTMYYDENEYNGNLDTKNIQNSTSAWEPDELSNKNGKKINKGNSLMRISN